MTEESYYEHVKRYIEISKTPIEKIYLPPQELQSDVSMQIYKYFSDAIEENNSKYKLNNPFFILTTNKEVNAHAISSKKYQTILLTKYTLDTVIGKLSSFTLPTQTQLTSDISSRWQNINNKILIDFSTFTVYHEIAHLLQARYSSEYNQSLSSLAEIYHNSEYTEIKHIKELDADIFATTALFNYQRMYLDQLKNDRGYSETLLQSLITILFISLTLFFFIITDKKLGFYLKEYHHPHPLLRLNYCTNVVRSIYSKIESVLPKVDFDEVLVQTFSSVSKILGYNSPNELYASINLTEKNAASMDAYSGEIFYKATQTPNLTLNNFLRGKY